MRLLVTRPEPDAQRTADALRTRGHSVISAPLMTIETIAPADFGRESFAAVLMTSASAARAVAGHPALKTIVALPLFAVGARTAEAARNIGFADIRSAAGAAGDLATLFRRDLPAQGRPILYLAGEDRAHDLAAMLPEHAVRTVVVYRAKAAGVMPQEAQIALNTRALDGVLHFSKRSAAIYVECARAARLDGPALQLVHYCLSSQAAEPVAAAGARDIRMAAQPDEATLFMLLEQN